MTPEFCCGAECGVAGAHLTLTGAGASFSTSSPLSGARSILCNAAATFAYCQTIAAVGAGLTVIRFRANFSTLPNANTALMNVSTSGAGVYFKQSDGKIYAGTSTTLLGATGVSITTNTTYYIDCRVNSTANPWLIDVSVNGTACGQYSSATAANTTAASHVIGIVNSATGTMLIDDIVVSTTSADYPIGDGYVNHFVPTADGTHNVIGANDFERSATGVDITNATTDAYTLVNDVPLESGTPTDYINLIAPPNATDYVEVVFGPAPGISTPTVAPRAVEVITCAGKGTGTGTNNLRLAVNDNGTLDDIFNADCSGTSPALRYPRKHYAVGPSGGAWAIGGGGNGDFTDLRMRCFSSDAAPDPWFISAMIEAEFAVSGALTLQVGDDLNATF